MMLHWLGSKLGLVSAFQQSINRWVGVSLVCVPWCVSSIHPFAAVGCLTETGDLVLVILNLKLVVIGKLKSENSKDFSIFLTLYMVRIPITKENKKM